MFELFHINVFQFMLIYVNTLVNINYSSEYFLESELKRQRGSVYIYLYLI